VAPHPRRPKLEYSPPIYWDFTNVKSQKSADHIYTMAEALSHTLMQLPVFLTLHYGVHIMVMIIRGLTRAKN